jgi:hypothetical protein
LIIIGGEMTTKKYIIFRLEAYDRKGRFERYSFFKENLIKIAG